MRGGVASGAAGSCRAEPPRSAPPAEFCSRCAAEVRAALWALLWAPLGTHRLPLLTASCPQALCQHLGALLTLCCVSQVLLGVLLRNYRVALLSRLFLKRFSYEFTWEKKNTEGLVYNWFVTAGRGRRKCQVKLVLSCCIFVQVALKGSFKERHAGY